jgi:hypothetical protein
MTMRDAKTLQRRIKELKTDLWQSTPARIRMPQDESQSLYLKVTVQNHNNVILPGADLLLGQLIGPFEDAWEAERWQHAAFSAFGDWARLYHKKDHLGFKIVQITPSILGGPACHKPSPETFGQRVGEAFYPKV